MCLSHVTCEAREFGPRAGSLRDSESLGPRLRASRVNFAQTAFSEVRYTLATPSKRKDTLFG
jgi:hypothetical protein